MVNENIGTSKDIKRLFRFLAEDDKESIDSFVGNHSFSEYREFSDLEQALMCTDNTSLYSQEVRDVFLNYSGFNYRRINASARDTWNYEEHGHINEKTKFDIVANDLKRAIDENQHSVGNIRVFRGVPLSYFSEYGITSLEEIKDLEGGFLLDKGFVSTSLVDEACYYKKENELGLNYNVKVEYLVPEEFGDGVSISNISYSPGQCEYLINSWNLAKVMSVRMDGDDGAIVSAMLIPKHVYDKGYRQNLGEVK